MSHLFVKKQEVIPAKEDKELFCTNEKDVDLFNKILISSDEKLKNYCDLHKLDYEKTDVEQVFKVVYPDTKFKFEDNKVIVNKKEDIKKYVISDGSVSISTVPNFYDTSVQTWVVPSPMISN